MFTGTYATGNPDDSNYDIYYAKAATIGGLATAAHTPLPHPPGSNIYQGQTAAALWPVNPPGGVLVFATTMPGNVIEHWVVFGGSPIWLGPTGFTGNFVDAVNHNGLLWLSWCDPSGQMWVASHAGSGFGTPIPLQGPPTIAGAINRLYVDSANDLWCYYSNGWGVTPDTYYFHKYTGSSWNPVPDFSLSNAPLPAGINDCDPLLTEYGGKYVFMWCPWDNANTRQWISYRSDTTMAGLVGLPTASNKWFTYGGTGVGNWKVDMWPRALVDGSNTYVFYGSERSTGNIWMYDLDWTMGEDHLDYIQPAIDEATDGDTINVAAGTYSGTMDIDTRSDLDIVGADKNTVIFKPSSTIPWNISPYGSSRQAAIRVVSSTDIMLKKMTMDFDDIKGNNVFGVLYWDSTGTVDDNILKNMSASDAMPGGLYYEITSYFRAPSYTDISRASITISNNTFIDTGRLGVCTHQYVDATITLNTFYKTIADFGYAIELGSESTGEITHNTIYGFDTAAASDGSNSAGIYVENAFTGTLFGWPGPAMTKNVLVEDNEIYDCQWGLYVGNEFNGYAGDVDIVATVKDNNIHDNLDGGALFTDEDMADGSSVTVTCQNNTLTNNGDYGYYIYTQGDGDLSVTLPGDTITGHDTGIYLEDTAGGASTSSYSISANYNDISGNTTYGINNTISAVTVDAEDNWWGDATGPYHPTTNSGGLGDQVSDYVDYDPWGGNSPVEITSATPQGSCCPVFLYKGSPMAFDITYNIYGAASLLYDVVAIASPRFGKKCKKFRDGKLRHRLYKAKATSVGAGSHAITIYEKPNNPGTYYKVPRCVKIYSPRNVVYKVRLKSGGSLVAQDVHKEIGQIGVNP